MDYNYIKKNLLECPEKYQRTKFYGKGFLESYKKSRIEIIKNNEVKNIEILIQKLKHNNYDDKTNKILKKILENIDSDNEDQINHLIKKFEISKKIYSAYDINWKAESLNYKNLDNYIILTTICILKYYKSKNLKFINTVLKLNDLVCSQIEKIKIDEDKKLLYYNIYKELEIIKQLQKRG